MRCGIVVGRFQVAELHHGHRELLDYVRDNSDCMVVFIAESRTGPTNRNPLKMWARRSMLHSAYPDALIMPIQDERSDVEWSNKLDLKITEFIDIIEDPTVILYGGPDSFLDVYTGKFLYIKRPSYERTGPEKMSGSVQRNKIAKTTHDDPIWREGVIYGIANQFPRVYVTVDCAVMFRRTDGGVDVLLGKKPGEDFWRFPGGFLNQGESLEKAVKREVYEETTMDLQNVEFIGSFPVDDWRYRNDPDAKITTCFHIGWASSYGAIAGDDLEIVRWFPAEKMPTLVGEHKMLCERFKEVVNKRFYYDSDDPSRGHCEGENNADSI